jgi:hypothetical protein
MQLRSLPLFFVSPLLLFAQLLTSGGCEKIQDGVIDPKGVPAFLSAARITPDSVKLTLLPESGGLLNVSVDVRVNVTMPAGSSTLRSVLGEVISSSGTDPFLQTSLHDDGASPDSIGGDGIYSGALRFGVLKSATGRYRVRISATTADGLLSNLIEKSLFMIRNNNPPRVSNLQAPDTVTVPAGGGTVITLAVKATDPDGQADIKEVYFKSLDSSDPNRKFIMKDDGGADPLSGDAAAGDSLYTILIPADNSTLRKTYRFLFLAADAFGDTSTAILHRLTIR